MWINLLASTKSHASRFDVVLATQDALSPLQTGLAILDNYDHGLQVSVRTNNYTETKTIPIQRNVWSHVVITWTADDNITYYVNSKTVSVAAGIHLLLIFIIYVTGLLKSRYTVYKSSLN